MLEQLQDIIYDYLGDDSFEIYPETEIAEIGISSLDLVSIVGDIEDIYNITIEDRDVPNIKTIQDLMDCIERHIA